jgi:hypothetical protein
VSGGYESTLDQAPGAKMRVNFTTVKGEVVGYSIVLLLATDTRVETIRVYDGTHGFSEMHRYSRVGGKQAGALFHDGTLAEGMQAAIEAVKRGHLGMIEGWRKR